MRSQNLVKINVSLRLYMEVDSEAIAQQRASEILEILGVFAPIEEWQIEPYWKIESYYGLTVRFTEVRDSEQLFYTSLDLASDGWTLRNMDSDPDAIWTPTGTAVFLANEVKWADLFIVREVADPRFVREQKVRVKKENPKLNEVYGMIGEIYALPSEDEDRFYAVAFGTEKLRVWSIAEADLEAVFGEEECTTQI
jgi:hypothetical protein